MVQVANLSALLKHIYVNIELPDCVLVRQTGSLSNLTQNDITFEPGDAMSVTFQPVLVTAGCTSHFHFTMNKGEKTAVLHTYVLIYSIYIILNGS